MATSTLISPIPTILNLKRKFPCSNSTACYRIAPYRPSVTKCQLFNNKTNSYFHDFHGKGIGFWLGRKLNIYVCAKDDGVDEAEKEARGESTMPERFRYLTKEVSDPPVRWPWFVGNLFSFTSDLLYSFFSCGLFEMWNLKI